MTAEVRWLRDQLEFARGESERMGEERDQRGRDLKEQSREVEWLRKELTVRDEAFFPNYRRMWDGITEEADVKESLGLTMAEEDDLPARTGLHGSAVGRRWKQTYQRGDEFYDWDGHAFHFVGGTPTSSDGSLAVYRPREAGSYLNELVAAVASSTLP